MIRIFKWWILLIQRWKIICSSCQAVIRISLLLLWRDHIIFRNRLSELKRKFSRVLLIDLRFLLIFLHRLTLQVTYRCWMIFLCLKKQKQFPKLLIELQSAKRVETRSQWQLNSHSQVSRKKKKNENRIKQWSKNQETNQKQRSFFMKTNQQSSQWTIEEYLEIAMEDSIKH